MLRKLDANLGESKNNQPTLSMNESKTCDEIVRTQSNSVAREPNLTVMESTETALSKTSRGQLSLASSTSSPQFAPIQKAAEKDKSETARSFVERTRLVFCIALLTFCMVNPFALLLNTISSGSASARFSNGLRTGPGLGLGELGKGASLGTDFSRINAGNRMLLSENGSERKLRAFL